MSSSLPAQSQQPLILIVGPTGVGKSDFAEHFAHLCQGEIINGDMGQFYTKLSIGTARPAWLNHPIPHHLFDIIDQPTDFSSIQFRERVEPLLSQITLRSHTPLVVGGSLFYQKSLFFRPVASCPSPARPHDTGEGNTLVPEDTSLWHQLLIRDPVRAHALNPHDLYRIKRALFVCEQTGHAASSYKPVFDPVRHKVLIFHISRTRAELYERINKRVLEMIAMGWMDEVRALAPDWKRWLMHKKIIGYNELLEEEARGNSIPSSACIEAIQKRTRHYAKRQLTFWKSYAQELEHFLPGSTHDINLTLQPYDLYLEKIFTLLRTRGLLCSSSLIG